MAKITDRIPLRKQFAPTPYDPSKVDKRSPAQKKAHARSFQIFQLRGLWSLCARLTEPRRSMARALIDDDLRALGAEPETDRQRERRLQYERDWAAAHPAGRDLTNIFADIVKGI